MKFYWIKPITHWRTGSRFFGFFRYAPCKCGCTKSYGWGFNFGLFGVNTGN